VIKRLYEFNFGFQPELDKKAYRKQLNFEFLKNSESIIFIVQSGVGKSRYGILIRLKTCKHRVRCLLNWTAYSRMEQIRVAASTDVIASGVKKSQITKWSLKRRTATSVKRPPRDDIKRGGIAALFTLFIPRNDNF